MTSPPMAITGGSSAADGVFAATTDGLFAALSCAAADADGW
jgi:hypothetical protein